MSAPRTRWLTELDWLELAAAIGLTGGLLDGLRAIGAHAGQFPRSFEAVLLATALYGVLAVALVALLPVRDRRKKLSPLALASFVTACTAMSIVGYYLTQLAARFGGRWELRTAIVFGTIVVLGRYVLWALPRLPRARAIVATLALGAASVGGALVTLSSGPTLAEKLDRPDPGESTAAVGDHVVTPAAHEPGDAPAPNILLVVLDTTRADHLSTYGYAQETSPFLTKLAQSGTLYANAISPAPWTVPSHASLFTGQFPSVHRAGNECRSLSSDFVTLAELLRSAGYETCGFSSNSCAGPQFGLGQGFEHFYEIYRLEGMRQRNPMANLALSPLLLHLFAHRGDKGAAAANRLVAETLDQRSHDHAARPFFFFVNYIEAHLPYDPPDAYRRRFVGEPLRPIIRNLTGHDWITETFRMIGNRQRVTREDYEQLGHLYDAEVRYQDRRLEELLGELQRRGVLDGTLVIVVADHGENLGEHDGLLDHCFSVHQTLLRVPLVVRYPRLYAGGLRYPHLVSTMGVFATALHAAGVEPSPDWRPPVRALPRSPDEPGLSFAISEYDLPVLDLSRLAAENPGLDIQPYAVRQVAFQDERHKIVVRSQGARAFYDLTSDLGEERPLDPGRVADGAALLREIEAWMASTPHPTRGPSATAENGTLDEDARASLRSLGYLQ